MNRLLAGALVLVAALIVPLAPVRGQDKEPELVGIKLSAWLKMLEKGKDTKERLRAVRAVGFIGQAKSRLVIPALVKALREDAAPEVRESAARALGRNVSEAFAKAREDKLDELPNYDEASKALVAQLKAGPSLSVREACASALGEIGPDAKDAVPALAATLKEKNVPLRSAAASALRRMGREARPALPELMVALGESSNDDLTRAESALALGHIGPEALAALPILRNALSDAKGPLSVRLASAEALGRLGKEAIPAVPALAAVLLEKGPAPKSKSAEAHAALRKAAITTLDGLGSDARAALPALVKTLDDPNPFVRCLTMHTVGHLGRDLESHREAVIKGLVRGLTDPAVEVVVSAVAGLGGLGSEGLGSEAAAIARELTRIKSRDSRRAIQDAIDSALARIQPKK